MLAESKPKPTRLSQIRQERESGDVGAAAPRGTGFQLIHDTLHGRSKIVEGFKCDAKFQILCWISIRDSSHFSKEFLSPLPSMTAQPVDFSVVQPAPGHGKPLTYTITEDDPLFIRKPMANALAVDQWLDNSRLAGQIRPLNHELAHQMANSLLLTTQREFAMLRFMNTVTDKKGWWTKVRTGRVAFNIPRGLMT